MADFWFLAKIRAMDVLSFYFIFYGFLCSLTVRPLCCCMDFALAVECWGCPLVAGFSCCTAQALGREGFNSYGVWAQELQLPGSGAQAQQLCTSLVALRHVGASWLRDWTCVSCTGRQILYHWATREALDVLFKCHWPPSGSSSLDLHLAYMVCQALLDA